MIRIKISFLKNIYSTEIKGNEKTIRFLGLKIKKIISSIPMSIPLPSSVQLLEQSNRVILIENGQEKDVPLNFFNGLTIIIKGKNNIVKIHAPYKFITSRLEINGENNLFEIGKTRHVVRNTNIIMMSLANNRKLIIGDDFACGGALIVNNVSGNFITIGNDCMFGVDIVLRADDGHVICKKGTKEIINNSKGTKIGNHVWVAQRAFIGKDVEIGDNSVVGACSVVVKGSLEQNVVWAGTPAKIIKRDIDWHRANHNSDIFKQ